MKDEDDVFFVLVSDDSDDDEVELCSTPDYPGPDIYDPVKVYVKGGGTRLGWLWKAPVLKSKGRAMRKSTSFKYEVVFDLESKPVQYPLVGVKNTVTKVDGPNLIEHARMQGLCDVNKSKLTALQRGRVESLLHGGHPPHSTLINSLMYHTRLVTIRMCRCFFRKNG